LTPSASRYPPAPLVCPCATGTCDGLGRDLSRRRVRHLDTPARCASPCFLADPLEVPNEVVDIVAAQLQIDDPFCAKSIRPTV
jgi:hypothetical protein